MRVLGTEIRPFLPNQTTLYRTARPYRQRTRPRYGTRECMQSGRHYGRPRHAELGHLGGMLGLGRRAAQKVAD